MTTWERLRADGVCGHCGTALAAGTPALVITVPAMTRRLLRCVACVDADADVAAPVARSGPADDWKQRQGGDDVES